MTDRITEEPQCRWPGCTKPTRKKRDSRRGRVGEGRPTKFCEEHKPLKAAR